MSATIDAMQPAILEGGDPSRAQKFKEIEDNVSLARQWTDTFGMGKYQYLRLLLPMMGCVADGTEVMLAGLLNYAITKEGKWDFSSDKKSTLASSVFIGMIIGSIGFGVLADRIGRKPTYLLVSCCLFAVSLTTAFSSSFEMLLIMRTLTGVFMGGQLPLSSTMAGEITPTANWAFVMGLLLCCFGLGSMFAGLMGYAALDHLGWHYFLGFCSIPSFIQAVCSLRYPETPRYAECKGKTEMLSEILTQMGKENGATDAQLNEMQEEIKLFGAVVAEREANSHQTTLSKIMMSFDLFAPSNLRLTLIYGFGWATCSFNQYGLNLFLAEVLKRRGIESDSIYIGSVVSCSAMIPASLMVGYLVNKFGHRQVLGSSLIVSGIFAMWFSVATSHGSLRASSWLFQFMLQISFVTMYVMTPISFTSQLRATAMGWCGGCTRSAGALTPFIIKALIGTGTSTIFHGYLFVLACNITVCFLLLFVRQEDLKRFYQI
uniref:Major facilitator superfamily (MFS) profile domain-containing protein n=1 Tax=Mucochytrium quahogii TaxID=96639 RepID=A0A7S2RB97_9STRA|mmetsp:Transcript_13713/g.22365  ORF Transcript_13713/g.22365 Transcript_13713/m.22365 type:complete len:489 (+) Transcript_13713:636-2102(+)|eukprot:CAMPEP_0203784962 /NCGR_PEP_ID=MMETSP0100_2-20121128/761_1 /ASSEMBLY_ACC=CAM_ASM_000210 /TAXON_ID=96639 /ORGANISM=" , Strain NY0313808BC1" /LENGTH=488 /DNA_ID=CAMNT_0050687009 /DNA_START=588 /DNA_END=2054 /DNA_ORIENTATION=+